MEIELQHTERANHAKEIVQSVVLGDYDGIVTVSGDGLIHEVINGVMARPDRDEFLKSIKFGFIPGGTSNGLVATLVHELNETGDLVHTAAFLIAKGRSKKMDLTELTMGEEN